MKLLLGLLGSIFSGAGASAMLFAQSALPDLSAPLELLGGLSIIGVAIYSVRLVIKTANDVSTLGEKQTSRLQEEIEQLRTENTTLREENRALLEQLYKRDEN